MTKRLLKKAFSSFGYEIKKRPVISAIKLWERPVGEMSYLLEDIKARGLKCNWIFDVGANRTDWSRMAKAIYSEANFCLIEPQVEMKPALEKFCDEFKNSFFVLSGAGATKQVKKLTVFDDLLGSSFLPETDEEQSDNIRKIEIVTIDSIIADKNIQAPELIKLDIQGFELEALKGASSTFGKTEVYILEVSFFEFHKNMPLFADVINFMLEKNYVVYDFPGFLRRPFDGALGQCDVCFVKKNGFLRNSNQWH